MIIITGAAGFIGSCMVKKLNQEGHRNLILVDDFSRADKNRNLANKHYIARIERTDFLIWFEKVAKEVTSVFHLGARTDTTDKDTQIFEELNVKYSQAIWKICSKHHIPLIYASSAATYGLGELGYEDCHDIITALKPLNPYAVSKNDFDIWAIQQEQKPRNWAGLKFFNVYGPNEYHKGRMASVIFHTLRQIKASGQMKLFRSHHADYKDGAQSRDFIYVKDVVNICYFFFKKYQNSSTKTPENGLYNVGTGTARTFWDLATNTFLAMDKTPNIGFIDTPLDIRETYQYFTEARMEKLRAAGYDAAFYSLEEGVENYVRNYLLETNYF